MNYGVNLAFLAVLMVLTFVQCSAQHGSNRSEMRADKVVKTNSEWKEILSAEDYYILREKGTERAFTGAYWNEKKDGIYSCKACNLALFDSSSKFKSGTGWPSFYEALTKDVISEKADHSYGMKRVEVLCNRCDCHLGHLFPDGPQPTGLRYCINSASLIFEEKSK